MLSGSGTPWNLPEANGYDREPHSAISGRAGPDGVAIGCFAWRDAHGIARNVVTAQSEIVLVLPVVPFSPYDYFTFTVAAGLRLTVIREGKNCVLANQGAFFIRFPQGAEIGARVYADPATGLPYTSNPGGYTATQWVAMHGGSAGSRVPISSFTQPFDDQ